MISELNSGKKSTHWMWYIFPQQAGLGSSHTVKEFAIKNKKEAIAYLNHPALGERLCQCYEVVLKHNQLNIKEIFGSPDYLKFNSCMTLFHSVSRDKELFMKAIDTFFQGEFDEKKKTT